MRLLYTITYLFTTTIFRLYDAATGGTPLWSEPWTGSNGVRVSDGLFNVMLGSLTTLPQATIAGRNQLFLGITVGTDDEMAPRVQLGSVPFAVQALTVPDGSMTTGKIADGAVTQSKLSGDLRLSSLYLFDDPPTVLETPHADPSNQWSTLDLKQWIPSNARAVILTILVDIDRENDAEFRVGFRGPGNTTSSWKVLAVDGHYTPGTMTWTHNQGIVGVSNGTVEWIAHRPGGSTKGQILVTLVGYFT